MLPTWLGLRTEVSDLWDNTAESDPWLFEYVLDIWLR
jgi:hypothetical protein